MFQIFQNLNASSQLTGLQSIDKITESNTYLGKIIEDKIKSDIVINSINIVTPNGDLIVPGLSLTIKQGMNLLITGPNGCGKSSLFRIICGLWPVQTGFIRRPKLKDLFYIPQKPYLPIGSLRDQIIYPDTVSDMKQKNISDIDLIEVLGIVFLQNVVAREGGSYHIIYILSFNNFRTFCVLDSIVILFFKIEKNGEN
jgi:ABC-type uncharacterized transport system fused permease/ATPase subunit